MDIIFEPEDDFIFEDDLLIDTSMQETKDPPITNVDTYMNKTMDNTDNFLDNIPSLDVITPGENEELSKYNIKTLQGISWDDFKSNFQWILNANIKDAELIYLAEYKTIGWLKGDWNEGLWVNGVWYDGTFNGTFQNGIFKKGIFQNGTFNGTFNGNWIDGTFENGKFDNAIWKNGVFLKGIFRKSTWSDGRFSGLFEDSIWEKGIFENGTFKDSTWKSGIFKMGIFEDSIWESGTWYDGEWQSVGDSPTTLTATNSPNEITSEEEIFEILDDIIEDKKAFKREQNKFLKEIDLYLPY